jgi:hypothetical protein
MTPIQVLHRRAKVDPKGIAFAAGGRNWSYARLARQSERVARERRFIAGQTGENNHLQHWKTLLSNDASVSLPVASDINSPAVLLATLEELASNVSLTRTQH